MNHDALEAGFIYILMRHEYSLSRSIRLKWLIDHLNKTVSVEKRDLLGPCTEELTVVSVVPREPSLEWKPDSSHMYMYLVTAHTAVIFLAQKYRTVYCLDMSPSLSSVDIQHGEVMIDEIFDSVKRSIEGFTRPFFIPGSCTLFSPEIYVTVIAHTPFITTSAQQVLVQGWHITLQNVQQFLDIVRSQFNQLENSFAEVAAVINKQHDAPQTESDNLVGGLFEENEDHPELSVKQLAVVSPDTSFVNLLRYGMLAVLLLPENSISNIIIVTDGVAIPDVQVFDTLLMQLRSCSIACSFLQVGSLFHPHCGLGMVPYTDVLQFIATSTLGVYMNDIPVIRGDKLWMMNVYHVSFLTWGCQKGSRGAALRHAPRQSEWHISNYYFYGCRESAMLRKKQAEDHIPCSLIGIIGLRLKEGYIVKNIVAADNGVEVSLVLQWRDNVYVEYTVSSEWPPPPAGSTTALVPPSSPASSWPPPGYVRYSIIIEAPYEFIHDITCVHKKPLKSPYRKKVVSRFWSLLKGISQADQLLVHLDSFASSPAASSVPECIRSGMPVFYLPPNSSIPVVTSSDLMCPQFAQFWRSVCMMEPAGPRQRWFHVSRAALVLLHDHPLPRHLHLANSSGRYHVVQCRQAAAALYALLKDHSTFVLVENHTYVKLVTGDSDNPPTIFYLIHVTVKPPCIVLTVAFVEGTPASLRDKVVQHLKDKISLLTFPQRPSNKEPMKRKISMARLQFNMRQTTPSLSSSTMDMNCCVLLRKPVEKILVRYERMPLDLTTIVFWDGMRPFSAALSGGQTVSVAAGGMVTTLSRYLHHQRWVWAAQSGPGSSLGRQALARILSILTKIRLQEGFCFAHSASGIINMVLEVKMKGSPAATHENIQPCVIQYVLFPPHTKCVLKESNSDDGTDDVEVDVESDEELEMITECWIEPQYGRVVDSPPERDYMENLEYHQIADMIRQVDSDCISSLLTFEQLSLMCSDSQVQFPPEDSNDRKEDVFQNERCDDDSATLVENRIWYFPFAFNLMNILPRCQQVEMLLSTFMQDVAVCSRDVGCNTIDPEDSSPNVYLMDMMYQHLKKLHDRELSLSPHNSMAFMQRLRERERDDAPYDLPVPFLLEDGTSGHIPSHSSVPSRKLESCECPMWRCFLKGISVTHVILTFVPASYQDLKQLMITKDSLNGNYPLSVRLLMDNDDVNRSTETGIGDQIVMDLCGRALSRSSPCQVQAGSVSSTELLQSGFRDCSAELPFRVRASSWDTVVRSSVPPEAQFRVDLNRLRTSSMDSKLKHFRPLLTPANSRDSCVFRTQVADKNMMNLSDGLLVAGEAPVYGNEMEKCRLGLKQCCKHRLCSLALPIYFYDCSLSMLMDVLIYGGTESHVAKDIYEDGTYKYNSSAKSSSYDNADVKHTSSDSKAEDSRNSAGKHSPQQHCEAISLIHSKCFVFSMFKALRFGQTIYAHDVQAAVDKCQDVTVEINITDFLKTVCGHMKSLLTKVRADETTQASTANSPVAQCGSSRVDEDQPSSGGASVSADATYNYPVSLLGQHGPCQPHHLFHQLIKDKFSRILTTSFRPVPSHPDVYFCAPTLESPQKDSKECISEKSPGVRSGTVSIVTPTSITQNIDHLGFHSHVSNITGFQTHSTSPWGEHLATPDEDSNTFSAAHSDSNSEVADSHSSKDVSPLFLRFTCSLHYEGAVHSCSVCMLPTCLGEMLPALEKSFHEINLKKLKITLDILCITLPPNVDAVVDALTHKGLRTTSFCSSSSAQYDEDVTEVCDEDKHVAAVEKEPPVDVDNLHILPPSQQKAVTLVVEETEWLMRDEIAGFLLDASPLLEEMLQFVADHVAASPGRASCLLERVPLEFVFDPSQCIEKFVQEFQRLHISGYLVRQVGQLYYLAKDESYGSRKKRHILVHPLSFMNVSQTHLDDGLEFWKEIYASQHNFASSDENINTLSGILTNAEELKNVQKATVKSLSTTEETDGICPDTSYLGQPQPEDSSAFSADRHSLLLSGASPADELFSIPMSPSLNLTACENQARTAQDDGMEELKRSQSYGVDQVMSPSCSSAMPWLRRHLVPGHRSEVSSIVESTLGTEDGYEGDSSDSADECDWIHEDSRLPPLPKFWLIMSVNKDAVTLYFHCRLHALQPVLVTSYMEVQRTMVSYVRELCKLVNQMCLLQELHDTRTCSPLLEPEPSDCIWVAGNSLAMSNEVVTSSNTLEDEGPPRGQSVEETRNFSPGCFACNVVWERQFFLHPRLKSGAGKPSLSRGIQALCTVLNRFSVNNRKNMFVYQDKMDNVFYLRLHEKLRWPSKMTPTSIGRSDTEDYSPGQVSRSSSVSSLNARKQHLRSMMSSVKSGEESVAQGGCIRQHVESFNDKESSYSHPEVITPSSLTSPLSVRVDDAAVLKVHGISEAGAELKEELVQVLQNRLDDAVLEVLYVMLARNPMCKLAPEDVHFIQKPYQPPDSVIQLSIPLRASSCLDAFVFYLRQNMLQFLYTPKYTDPHPENHFQDYSQPEASGKRVEEGNLFLYNQSAASGSKGIACVALAVLGCEGSVREHLSCRKPCPLAYLQRLDVSQFDSVTSTSILQAEDSTPRGELKRWVEFRIWKQGKINAESLVQKLQTCVQNTMWDLLMEFHWLTAPLSKQKGMADFNIQEAGSFMSSTTELQKISVLSDPNPDSFKQAADIDLLKEWFEFAVQLRVPSVKKFVVSLSARHSLLVMVKELQNIITLNAPDTEATLLIEPPSETPASPVRTQSAMFKDQQLCVVVGRNLCQWRACIVDRNNYDADCLHPKAQKTLEKFPPLIDMSSNPFQFVPRQRLCLVLLTSQQIMVYVYNWSKERVDSLMKQTTMLGHWLSARACLLSSVSSQKLGVFHNQEMIRQRMQAKPKQAQNPLMHPSLKVDQLIMFSALGSSQKNPSIQHMPVKTNVRMCNDGAVLPEVFRDAKLGKPVHLSASYLEGNVVGLNAQQLLDTLQQDRKDEHKKLCLMWQTRGAASNILLAEDIIHLFKQHSRIIHYCLTPLLFLPRWRVHSAATRDHSLLPVHECVPGHSAVEASSGGKGTLTTEDVAQDGIRNSDSRKQWHDSLCNNFVKEYKQYLQCLGFIPIQSEPATHRTGQSHKTSAKQNELRNIPNEQNNICYLQKSLLGGVLLFEIFLCEPFFHARLHALECSRLQSKCSNSLVSQFTLSFLDECDKIKILMHLHSFTYDYHLRCIHNYIAEKQAVLRQGYHVTRFVDDFLKYYSKAPNFARNLVYSGSVHICGLMVRAPQLYDYLLSHSRVFGMDVFCMAPVCCEADSTADSEYILVCLDSMPRVTYRDVNDTKHTDDFNVTIIVAHETKKRDDNVDASAKDDRNDIHLKFYVILTSRRERFPKLEVEHRLGTFRTVSTLSATTVKDSTPWASPGRTEENYPEDSSEDSSSLESTLLSASETVVAPSSPQSLTEHTLHDKKHQLHLAIRQERVNYLGYYSSQEQLMHQLITKQADSTQVHIADMVSKGMVHCRTHLLWNQLQCTLPRKEDVHAKTTGLSFSEFTELLGLARLESLGQLDPRLAPLLCQPLAWYQSLAKVLAIKYADHHRIFSSPDGNELYLAVLHPRYLEAFVMLSINMQASRGDLSAVYRKTMGSDVQKLDRLEFCLAEIETLIESFVSACCFHLWAGLL